MVSPQYFLYLVNPIRMHSARAKIPFFWQDLKRNSSEIHYTLLRFDYWDLQSLKCSVRSTFFRKLPHCDIWSNLKAVMNNACALSTRFDCSLSGVMMLLWFFPVQAFCTNRRHDKHISTRHLMNTLKDVNWQNIWNLLRANIYQDINSPIE